MTPKNATCGPVDVGYCNIYAQGMVGLFTEEGFSAYVKLSELAFEDLGLSSTKLGQPLRGKGEAQLSIGQSLEPVEGLKDIEDNKMTQRLAATATEREDTNETSELLSIQREPKDPWQKCNHAEYYSARLEEVSPPRP